MEHTHNDTSSNYQNCTLELDQNVLRIALFLLYLLIFIAGLLGNLLVLWVNWRRRRSSNGVLFCVLNVSLSDLMVVVVLPFFMMEVMIKRVWLWGRFLCKVTNLVFAVNSYSSSFFLALMTLERYLSVTKPAFPAPFPVVGRRRWWLWGGVWLFSFFLALFENVHVDLGEWDDPGCHMWPEDNYVEWFASLSFLKLIFQFLGPSAVIITCNTLISRAVRAAPDVQDPRDVWLVHVYSLVFVLCWLPYHLIVLVIIIDFLNGSFYSCNVQIGLDYSYEIVKVLSLFHCVANPILYNILGKAFRGHLIDKAMAYVNREGGNVAQAEARTRPSGRGRTISNASTSHSDVDS